MDSLLFKIATNSHHIVHPFTDDQSRYKKWDKRGLMVFAVATILTGGLAGLVILGTALAKLARLKKLSSEEKSVKKIDKSADKVFKKADIKESKRAETNRSVTKEIAGTEKDKTESKKETTEAKKEPSETEKEEPETKIDEKEKGIDEKNQRRVDFVNKFDNSAPNIYPIPGKSFEQIQDLFHQELTKFISFLKSEIAKPSDDHLVYFSAGHGTVQDQIWPGFVFEALQNDQKVRTILIEQGWKYPDYHRAYVEMINQYKANYLDQRPDFENHLPNFSVSQFLCGLVDSGSKLYDPAEKIFDISRPRWKDKKQLEEAEALLPQYFEKLLSEGKQVVIGFHIGGFGLDEQLVSIYNQLIEKYPKQLHFVWGWGHFNLVTHQKINEKDLADPANPTDIWHKYDNLTYIQFSEEPK